jgi:hypothetical protein
MSVAKETAEWADCGAVVTRGSAPLLEAVGSSISVSES